MRVHGFLYAASHEESNDYYLIIGTAGTAPQKKYITAIISGLPPNNSPSFSKLNAVRNEFKKFFDTALPRNTYDFYDPPIPVEIEGSLFVGVGYPAVRARGPSRLRDELNQMWEIRPVTKITFQP